MRVSRTVVALARELATFGFNHGVPYTSWQQAVDEIRRAFPMTAEQLAIARRLDPAISPDTLLSVAAALFRQAIRAPLGLRELVGAV